MATPHHSFWADFRLFFVRGLAVLLPSIVTLWLLFQAFLFLYNNVAAPINSGIRLAIVEITPRVISDPNLPDWFRATSSEVDQFRETTADPLLREADDSRIRNHVRRQKLESFWDTWAFGLLRLTGLLVAIVLLYLGGRLLGSFVGKYFFGRVEALLRAIPGFKQVYPHVKQVVDLIMGDSQMAFRRVVLVQYPREGIWTVGLVTSSSMKSIAEQVQGDVLSVFIPTSPTPFTGFTINMPADECVDVDMTIEQALRFVITAGVLVPEGHEMPAATGVPQIHVPEIQPAEGEQRADPARPKDEEDKASES